MIKSSPSFRSNTKGDLIPFGKIKRRRKENSWSTGSSRGREMLGWSNLGKTPIGAQAFKLFRTLKKSKKSLADKKRINREGKELISYNNTSCPSSTKNENLTFEPMSASPASTAIRKCIGTRMGISAQLQSNSTWRTSITSSSTSPTMQFKSTTKTMANLNLGTNSAMLIFSDIWTQSTMLGSSRTKSYDFTSRPTRKWRYYSCKVETSSWHFQVSLHQNQSHQKRVFLLNFWIRFHDRWKLQSVAHLMQHQPVSLTLLSIVRSSHP